MVFDKLAQLWPQAHCELVHYSDFQLLVAVVLSAQATDVSVNRSFGAFLSKAREFGPREMVKLGEAGFLDVIKSIGLAPTKARNCVALSKIIILKHKGEVPRLRDELEELPGVGRKTANVVLNVAFGQPTMAVDTHVARLAVRFGFVAPGVDREKIEARLIQLVPKRHAAQAHHHLIFHGRYLCVARKPKCSECKISKHCPKIGVNGSAD
jgi:endonuclease-3